MKEVPWFQKILKQKNKILALAPMADLTDSPFCQTIKQIGSVDVMFREMVSSEAIVRGSEKTLKMAEFNKKEKPIVLQIFGAEEDIMARAADILVNKYNPDGIDINMGCPVPKIVSNFNGCALMRDPKKAIAIVKKVKNAIGNIPLSVKIRLGWSSPDEFQDFIPILEEGGVDLITVHGRTKNQGYTGKSDWQRIKIAKEIASVPLIANGDVHEPELVAQCLQQTGADGVAIARGALGNPWFFMQAKNILNNNPQEIICFSEKKKVIYQHAKKHVEHYGERGIFTFRKHLAWYFKNNRLKEELPNLKEFKVSLMQVKSLEELENFLKSKV